jgi:hypothetical protein
MRLRLPLVVAILIPLLAVSCSTHPLSISCQVHVPYEFQQNSPGWKSLTGEPESVRYRVSYEAFFWNCVMVKAVDLRGRCPFMCSGTPAATYGCSKGAKDAEREIKQLLADHDATRVRKYLRFVAASPEGKEKMAPYFPSGPRTEKIIE